MRSIFIKNIIFLVQIIVCKNIGHQRFRPYGRYSPLSQGCLCPAKAEIWKVLTKTSNSISHDRTT